MPSPCRPCRGVERQVEQSVKDIETAKLQLEEERRIRRNRQGTLTPAIRLLFACYLPAIRLLFACTSHALRLHFACHLPAIRLRACFSASGAVHCLPLLALRATDDLLPCFPLPRVAAVVRIRHAGARGRSAHRQTDMRAVGCCCGTGSHSIV